MGAPPQSLLHSLNVKGMVLHKKGISSSLNSPNNPSPNMNGSLLLEPQKSLTIGNKPKSSSSSQSSTMKATLRSRNRSREFVMKKKRRRMARQEGGGRSRSNNGIEKRVRTLKRLVPTRESDDGLDVLFRDTAAYIMSLQMRVRVMQIMVDVLDASQDHHH